MCGVSARWVRAVTIVCGEPKRAGEICQCSLHQIVTQSFVVRAASTSLRSVKVSLADVAREVGVHPGTASKALNPATRSRVSALTARRVLAAAERLGYHPNTLARGLRTRQSYSVGLIIPDLTNHAHAKNLTYKLIERGFSDADIEKILRGNWLRVLREWL